MMSYYLIGCLAVSSLANCCNGPLVRDLRLPYSAVCASIYSYDAEVMQGERTMMFFCESTLDAKPILDGYAARLAGMILPASLFA